MMKDFQGKVAFITGGANGIGLAIARTLARLGMRIVIADMDEAARKAANDEFVQPGRDVLTVQLDVANLESWQSAVERVEGHFGSIDLLCNKAGIGQGRMPNGAPIGVTEMSPELWRLIVDINVTGVFLGVRTVAPLMIRSGKGGHIVNTSSMAGLFSPPGLTAYSASKFAVFGLSEGLRTELAPYGIGVSVLCPGTVESKLSATSAARRAAIAGMTGEAEARLSTVSTLTGKLMGAASVGERVLEGIRKDELYIITHPEYWPLIEERFDALKAAIGPSADPGHVDSEDLLLRSRNPVYAINIAHSIPGRRKPPRGFEGDLGARSAQGNRDVNDTVSVSASGHIRARDDLIKGSHV